MNNLAVDILNGPRISESGSVIFFQMPLLFNEPVLWRGSSIVSLHNRPQPCSALDSWAQTSKGQLLVLLAQTMVSLPPGQVCPFCWVMRVSAPNSKACRAWVTGPYLP
jgi:hypothetical protein